MDYSSLIISILEKYGVEYWEEGKNVTEDAVNIECPLCEDASNHCGIFRDSLQFKCWRCSQSGNFAYLIAVITGQPKDVCKQEIEEFTTSFHLDPELQIQQILQGDLETEEKKAKRKFSGKWPEYTEPLDPEFPLLQYYLEERSRRAAEDLEFQTLLEYECQMCRVGPYMNRLIIPVFFQDKLVGYQGADMTLRSETKYKTSDNEINQYLYNWDRIDPYKDYLILAEGLLDVWRLGGNTLGTFGSTLTDIQFRLILKYKPKKLIFCWDEDAYFVSEREAQKFEPFIEEVFTVSFPEGEDPDSYGHVASWELINQECFS
jgi:hypothetical protein